MLYPLITPVPPGPCDWKGRFVRHLNPEPRPALSQGEVHVWIAGPVASPQRLHQLEQALGAGERSRMPSIRSESYRSSFVETHAVLRHVLSLYVRAAPAGLLFGFDHAQCPALLWPPQDPPLRFGLVFHEPFAIVALRQNYAIDLRIGADCEPPSAAGSIAFYVARKQIVTLDSPGPVSDVHLFPMDARTLLAPGEALPAALPGLVGHVDGEVGGGADVVGPILGPDPVVRDPGRKVVHRRGMARGRPGR